METRFLVAALSVLVGCAGSGGGGGGNSQEAKVNGKPATEAFAEYQSKTLGSCQERNLATRYVAMMRVMDRASTKSAELVGGLYIKEDGNFLLKVKSLSNNHEEEASGKWSIEGVSLVLSGVGRATAIDSTENGVKKKALLINGEVGNFAGVDFYGEVRLKYLSNEDLNATCGAVVEPKPTVAPTPVPVATPQPTPQPSPPENIYNKCLAYLLQKNYSPSTGKTTCSGLTANQFDCVKLLMESNYSPSTARSTCVNE